jgi:hypothetical protein
LGRSWFEGSWDKKFQDTSQMHACNNTSYTGGMGRGITLKSDPGQRHKTLAEKIIKGRRMAKMIEHLPNKCKALSSNSITAKIPSGRETEKEKKMQLCSLQDQ